MTSTALVARATVEDIVAGRDRTVALFDEAIARIAEADAAVKAANDMLERTAPRSINSFTYDRIREIDDFRKAVALAIMSAGTEFRETRKAAAFRKLVADNGGAFEDMPAGSFAEVGTYVNTVIVTMHKRSQGE